ncbi:NAD(P) transhydrogenase subunit alpha [Actinoplanes sp. LDG1-06]|uniref:proton-translocating NAD(P)(+) transhydrogenase n=1 Tax=Paractinoplanes ovalisporus TaxID=2810368 RepID=A0ABS2A8Z3_9ACTN|nr:NAD(P) transhydrogenase subunit alpha [Actinoplanes ovalisporus]MBM2616312.1 NAD(P) transhydrogenase subunit alpha [Actinoplanes ovalisporus]
MTSVGVLRETADDERRVAFTPDTARTLAGRDARVLVEAGAGQAAFFADDAYTAASVVSRERVYDDSEVLLCLRLPPDAAARCRPGQVLVGQLDPLDDPGPVHQLAAAGVTAVSLDLLPRTLSRAQPMDALTSQANVAGYKAAVLAAETYPGFFPMLTTAAGTTRPAQVLVVGAGVAGLQAIATARRLGARVTGYDVRAAAQADIASTGATVLDLGQAQSTDDGYARTLLHDEADRQRDALTGVVPRFDVVITTARVPGGRSPLLVTEAALYAMRPGSVVVDLGGNVEGVPAATRRLVGDVTVITAPELAATVPAAASTAYARNVLALLGLLMPDGVPDPGRDDEILRAVVVSEGGQVIHPRVLAALADRAGAPS